MYKEMLRATSQKWYQKSVHQEMEADNLWGMWADLKPASFSLNILIPGHVSHFPTESVKAQIPSWANQSSYSKVK